MKRRGFLAGLLAAVVTRRVTLPEAPVADDHATHLKAHVEVRKKLQEYPRWVEIPPEAGVGLVADGYLPKPVGPTYVQVYSEADYWRIVRTFRAPRRAGLA